MYLLKIPLLARLDKYIRQHPNINFIATEDIGQLYPINSEHKSTYYEECMNKVFPNQLLLKINKRLKTDKKRGQLEYEKNKMGVEDYIKFEAGHTIINDKTKKPWTKSLKDGVNIPNNNDYTTKKYNANINLLKRHSPDANGIMHPYNYKETENIYNATKQRYSLTDSDMMTNYFDVDFTICDSF